MIIGELKTRERMDEVLVTQGLNHSKPWKENGY
jgi:hypothetical protein